MELHERVARCFTDAIAEWSRDEIEKIMAMPEFNRAFASMHKEIQDRAVMDIVSRAGEKMAQL